MGVQGEFDRRRLAGPPELESVLPTAEDNGTAAGVGDALEDLMEPETEEQEAAAARARA